MRVRVELVLVVVVKVVSVSVVVLSVSVVLVRRVRLVLVIGADVVSSESSFSPRRGSSESSRTTGDRSLPCNKMKRLKTKRAKVNPNMVKKRHKGQQMN